MPITVANQRTIHIHREAAKYDFLGIKNENWQAASRTLGAHGLLLYLYFASNRNGYELASSPAAIEAQIGMPRSTYRDQFRKLLNNGYLIDRGGNHFDFYETPQSVSRSTDNEIGYNFENTTDAQDKAQTAYVKACEDIEINNTNNINTMQEKQVSPATVRYFDF